MVRLGRRRLRSVDCWIIVAIILALVLLAGVLAVNIAGQGYEQQTFRSSAYNQSSPSFPANFLRGSLKDQSCCDAQRIRQGDGEYPCQDFGIVDIFSGTNESFYVRIQSR